MEWFKKFWNSHGERLTFATLALTIATVMYFIELKAEANTIIIGMAMLFFNKARGTNGSAQPKEIEDEPKQV